MAGFRRLVSEITRNSPVDSEREEEYEESEASSSSTPFSGQRTSTPIDFHTLPSRMFARNPHPQPPRTFFPPSFFESYGSPMFYRQYPEHGSPNMQFNQPALEQGTSLRRSNSEKPSSKWSIAETDALVYAWRDSFVELESAKSATAWRRILETVNEKGNGRKTLEQVKKKLRNLKDRYKEAKAKSKRSGEAGSFPKYFEIFDEVLGTRSLVQFGEVRETTSDALEETSNWAQEIATPQQQQQGAVPEQQQEKSNKKKKATKSAAASQLVNFLGEMQKKQQETMKEFLDGIKEIEESSRKYTADTILSVAKIFADKGERRRKRKKEGSSSENEEN